MDQAHRFETVQVGHENIDDDQIEWLGLQQLQAFIPIVGHSDFVKFPFQQYLDRCQDRVVVIDDQNARHGGSQRVNVPNRYRQSSPILLPVQDAIALSAIKQVPDRPLG
jgi:hypothetical protein